MIMDKTLLPQRDKGTIEASVTIQRSVEDVFSFYRDFRNLPRFLGDVMAIEQIGPATSRWTIQGLLGIRASWTIKVTELRGESLMKGALYARFTGCSEADTERWSGNRPFQH